MRPSIDERERRLGDPRIWIRGSIVLVLLLVAGCAGGDGEGARPPSSEADAAHEDGRIDVPAGRYDCWKLQLHDGQEGALTLWATKDRGWLVKTEQRGLDWRTESVLVSATPPAP